MRKAVRVRACRIPMGAPVGEKRVTAPVGLIWGLLLLLVVLLRFGMMVGLGLVGEGTAGGGGASVCGGVRVMTLMPRPAGLLEGIKSVFAPVRDELTTVRCGWWMSESSSSGWAPTE